MQDCEGVMKSLRSVRVLYTDSDTSDSLKDIFQHTKAPENAIRILSGLCLEMEGVQLADSGWARHKKLSDCKAATVLLTKRELDLDRLIE